MKRRKPATIAEYLSTLTADKRAALTALRRSILKAAPDAEECISYGIPAFRWNGRVLVYFSAATHHCSFFPGAHPIAALATELRDYSTSKGTVRFPVNAPLPAALVRKLVAVRMTELAQKPSLKPSPAGRSKERPKTRCG